jgi:hypothetical protein
MCVAFHQEALLISWVWNNNDYLIQAIVMLDISMSFHAMHFVIQFKSFVCYVLTGYDVDLIPKIKHNIVKLYKCPSVERKKIQRQGFYSLHDA